MTGLDIDSIVESRIRPRRALRPTTAVTGALNNPNSLRTRAITIRFITSMGPWYSPRRTRWRFARRFVNKTDPHLAAAAVVAIGDGRRGAGVVVGESVGAHIFEIEAHRDFTQAALAPDSENPFLPNSSKCQLIKTAHNNALPKVRAGHWTIGSYTISSS